MQGSIVSNADLFAAKLVELVREEVPSAFCPHGVVDPAHGLDALGVRMRPEPLAVGDVLLAIGFNAPLRLQLPRIL